MKDNIINQCLLILKRNDVKEELKNLLSPLIDLILVQINPYIYLSLIFVIISFLCEWGAAPKKGGCNFCPWLW